VWQFALAELIRRHDRWTAFSIIDLSQHKDFPARHRSAIEALQSFDIEDEKKFLLSALDDSVLRKRAIHRVEKNPDSVEPLLRILADRSVDYHLRSQAASILGEIGDRRAVWALCSALEHHFDDDPFYHVTSAAAWALRKIGDQAALPALRAVHSPQLVGRTFHDDDYSTSAADAAGSIDAVIHFLEREPKYPA
jgi:HEAT repeat protein